MAMKEYRREVLYYETDRMGIVHNSNYLRYFEEARLHHMQQSGLPYYKLEERGIIIPQTEAHIKYENILRYGDTFQVAVKLTEYTGVRLSYEYKITDAETRRAVAEGKTSHCFLDDAKRVPVNLKRRLPELSEVFEKNIDE